MKKVVILIFFIVLLSLSIGVYLQNIKHPIAEKIMGISVLVIIFVLIPLFLYYRFKEKNLNDYILDKEKWEKIKENFKKNNR